MITTQATEWERMQNFKLKKSDREKRSKVNGKKSSWSIYSRP